MDMMLSSLSKECNHNCSIIMFIIAWYSNYIEEHEIVYCFLMEQLMRFFLMYITYHLVDFLSSKKYVQSSHRKNYKVRLVVFENYNPW